MPDYLTPATGADTVPLEDVATRRALALVARLPAEQAEVVRLRVLAGLDTEAVATAMGKTPGAIRVFQHRALRRLAEIVASEPL